MNPALLSATHSTILCADLPEREVGLRHLHEAAVMLFDSARQRMVPVEEVHDEDGDVLGAVGILVEDETRGPIINGRPAEPELYQAWTSEHGWSVKVKRNGATFEYGLFSRHCGILNVSIDPLADEEADVFECSLLVRGGLAPFVCRAILLNIEGVELPLGFTRHRCLADVHDWQTVEAAGGPAYPVYVKDDAGRHGMGWLGTDGKWRVASGRTDPARVIARAVMEAA